MCRNMGWLLMLTLMATTVAGAPPEAGGVPDGDVGRRAVTLARGRAIDALVVQGNAAALFRRFDAPMAKAVPETALRPLLKPRLGRRQGEAAFFGAPRGTRYETDHAAASGQVLRVSITFDAAGRVSGLLLKPRPALPLDPKARYRTKTTLRLPFNGRWWVFWGGDTRVQNYHMIAADQRHASDFCVWRQGGTHRGDGTHDADYWAWGRDVVAPGNAVVVEVADGITDNTPGVMNPGQPAGNPVVLDFGDGEYALLAHLRRGTVRVRLGFRVRAGQVVGECGNSGNSSEPHLHIHLQDRARLFGEASGLPLAFTHYRANGNAVGRGEPVQGQFVQDAESE